MGDEDAVACNDPLRVHDDCNRLWHAGTPNRYEKGGREDDERRADGETKRAEREEGERRKVKGCGEAFRQGGVTASPARA